MAYLSPGIKGQSGRMEMGKRPKELQSKVHFTTLQATKLMDL